MKVKFVIGYQTRFGQNLYIAGLDLGQGERDSIVNMKLASGELWEAEIDLDHELPQYYHYVLVDGQNGSTLHEFGGSRELRVKQGDEAIVRDFWRTDGIPQNLLTKAPFSNAFFKRVTKEEPAQKDNHEKLTLRLRATRITADCQFGVLGSISSLGNWDESRGILMGEGSFPIWSAGIGLSKEETSFEYKYVIYSLTEKRIVTWEQGENRRISFADYQDFNKPIVVTDENFRYPNGEWRTSGVAIPVFSLRSKNGAGVGEFNDLKQLVDWSATTGMKVIQVLPVNDTVATQTWKDSYPYAAISVQALHPVYANLTSIGQLKDEKLSAKISKQAERLNQLSEVDYEGVMKLKSQFFKAIYDQEKKVFLKSKSFKDFLERSESWIHDYAAFSYLRDKYKTPDFTQWGKHTSLTDQEVTTLVSPNQEHYDDIAVHYFIQYHLDKQLSEATAYAREKGVVLKGDIPIGVYRNSVDAWRLPHLFNMDTQTGAPPDDFSITGQNWGFPTYNWEEMEKDGFNWWKERMVKMSDYFDVFRIDHILGFFRIWEIPFEQVDGLLGRFNPSLPFSLEELSSNGLHFDYDRFCKPYIRHHMIQDIFGSSANYVMDFFLNENAPDCFDLKAEFDTQKKVKVHFDRLIDENPERADFHNKMRFNLYSLHAEVLFLEHPNSDNSSFNPRINFKTTYSYRELDHQTKEVLNGLHDHYFYHRHNEFWRESAMKKLPMLKDVTDMLICGEDLGMVPASVPGVMSELQILSLAIQRMPNDDREFWHPRDTPYFSVTSTGSHDVTTLREWWEEDAFRAQRFYENILGRRDSAPSLCETWIAQEIIEQHLHSPSMLAIFPIQDLLAMDESLRADESKSERINVPANPEHYWRYRCHLDMDQLIGAQDFNHFLGELISQAGRSLDY